MLLTVIFDVVPLCYCIYMTMILTDRHESECNKMTEKYSFDTGLSCGDDMTVVNTSCF